MCTDNSVFKPALLLEAPRRVARDHYQLNIRMEAGEPMPGQFVNIRVSGATDPLIRRPFSVFDYSDGVTSVVVRVVGRGTELISRMRPGDIDLLGPLGRGFTLLKDADVLLVGGGVGAAPLFYLMKVLKKNNCRITCLIGAASKDLLFMQDEFMALSNSLIVYTDDGSEGQAGYVTAGMAEICADKKFDMIYTCGPDPMMRQCVGTAAGVPVEVSLENYFGCGIGLCVGCSVETVSGQKRACVDGPVFRGADLLEFRPVS
jgi:dihydroorotate dehydrogenase electron transfer subunit